MGLETNRCTHEMYNTILLLALVQDNDSVILGYKPFSVIVYILTSSPFGWSSFLLSVLCV